MNNRSNSKGRLFLGAALFVSLLLPIANAQSPDLAAESHHARELMAQGRFEEAIPIYRKLVDAVPGNTGLLLNLGLAEEMAGHPQAAVPHLQAVLKTQPNNVPALSMLADAYSSQQRYAEAAPLYRKLTESNPSIPQAWFGLGKSYESLASATFERLSKAAPESPYVAALLADSRVQRKQFHSAFFFYQQAEAKLPNLPGLHAGLARVYENTGHADWASTEKNDESALEKTPCVLATPECLYRKGDYLAATRLKPDSGAESLFWATKAYNRLAVDAFDQLGKFPDSVEIHAVKAGIFHGHGQEAEAANEWKAALALSPGNPQLQAELVRSLFLAHRYDEVMPMLKEMLAKNGPEPDLNFMLGESLWRTQQPEKALPYLAEAIKEQPTLLPAHAAIGMVYALLNQSSEAIPHLEKALPLDDDGSLHYSLARAYQSAGNTVAAQKTMQEYQQIKQKNQQINDELAKEAEITAPK